MRPLKHILFFALFALLLPDAKAVVFPTSYEVLIAQRIEYLNRLRKFSADLFWKDFGGDSAVGPVVYFTASASYFFNPNQLVLDRVDGKYEIVASPAKTKMLKLKNPFDSAVNIMEAQFEYEESLKNRISYRNPVLFLSSTEDIANYDHNIRSTEDWAFSALHEYFHQYQFRHDAIYNYIMSLVKQKRIMNRDTLQGIYRTNQAFHDTLVLENECLLKALAATDIEQEKTYYKEFLRLRNKRRMEYSKEHKFQFNIPEDFWEKIEGTSQYLEAVAKKYISQFPVDSVLLETDPMYKAHAGFLNFSFDTAPEYYDCQQANYYLGATGFNLVRLLEKHQVEYKDNFFNYASLPLHMQLKYFYKL